MELSAVLTGVDGRGLAYTGAPKSALDVGEAGRVWASTRRVSSWVTLKVDIEGRAEIGSVTFLLALDGVVSLERVEAEVGVGIYRGLKIGERSNIALGYRR